MSHQILMKHFPTFVDWNAPAAWAVHCTKLVFQSFHFQSKEKPLGFLLRKLMNTTSSDKNRRRPMKPTSSDIIFVKKATQFLFGNLGVPIYKKIGNFFFNSKIHHEFELFSLQSICLFNSPFPEFQFVFYCSWSQDALLTCLEASKSSYLFSSSLFCFINRA